MILILLVMLGSVEYSLSADTLRQGEILYISVHTQQQGLLSLSYRGTQYPLIPWGDGYAAMIGTSYRTEPGRKSIRIEFSSGHDDPEIIDTSIVVVPEDFRRSDITLPTSKQGTVDTTLQRRKQDEYRMVVVAINSPSEEFYSWLPEINPCELKISGTYGDERWINGQRAWHHSGLDFAVARGTPILAPCAARVIMARDTFIRQGNFVMLDHGAGIKTSYYHMESRAVEEGDTVHTGDTLGFVGSTGLATGPHLHLSLYINGVPVDPLFWLERRNPALGMSESVKKVINYQW